MEYFVILNAWTLAAHLFKKVMSLSLKNYMFTSIRPDSYITKALGAHILICFFSCYEYNHMAYWHQIWSCLAWSAACSFAKIENGISCTATCCTRLFATNVFLFPNFMNLDVWLKIYAILCLRNTWTRPKSDLDPIQ